MGQGVRIRLQAAAPYIDPCGAAAYDPSLIFVAVNPGESASPSERMHDCDGRSLLCVLLQAAQVRPLRADLPQTCKLRIESVAETDIATTYRLARITAEATTLSIVRFKDTWDRENKEPWNLELSSSNRIAVLF